MSEQFMGEIRFFSFPFAPRNWALCQGQTLAVNQNQALFSLLGTQYGGNGSTTFMLPDLRGRTPISISQALPTGAVSGVETVTLNPNQLPPHNHNVLASATAADQGDPGPTMVLASNQFYSLPGAPQPMNAGVLSSFPAQPHSNIQPTLVLNYCIALQGIFPSRN